MHSFGDWNALHISWILFADCAINQELKMWKIQSEIFETMFSPSAPKKYFPSTYAGPNLWEMVEIVECL